MQRAQAALSNAAANQFGVANTRFVWGSNKMAAQEGNLMMAAYDMSGERRFLDSAQVQLDYLLGRNVFQQSFVSEIGTNSVANLHHIFRRANDLKLPGFMVGGPNNGAQANIAPKDQNFLSYADHDKSYATNEYAID